MLGTVAKGSGLTLGMLAALESAGVMWGEGCSFARRPSESGESQPMEVGGVEPPTRVSGVERASEQAVEWVAR